MICDPSKEGGEYCPQDRIVSKELRKNIIAQDVVDEVVSAMTDDGYWYNIVRLDIEYNGNAYSKFATIAKKVPYPKKLVLVMLHC